MGCGKSEHDAVATGNTTTIRNSSKRLNAVENRVVKSGSKKLKCEQCGNSVNMKSLTEKVQNSVAGKGEEGKEGQERRSGDTNQLGDEVEAIAKDPKPEEGKKGVVVAVVEAISKDPEPEEGKEKEETVVVAVLEAIARDPEPKDGEKEETEVVALAEAIAGDTEPVEGKEKKETEAVAVVDAITKDPEPEEGKEKEETEAVALVEAITKDLKPTDGEERKKEQVEEVEGATESLTGEDSDSKGQLEHDSAMLDMGEEEDIDDNVEVVENVVEEKGQVENDSVVQETGEEDDIDENVKVAEDVVEEKGQVEEIKVDNIIEEAEEEGKSGDGKDPTHDKEEGVTSATVEEKTD